MILRKGRGKNGESGALRLENVNGGKEGLHIADSELLIANRSTNAGQAGLNVADSRSNNSLNSMKYWTAAIALFFMTSAGLWAEYDRSLLRELQGVGLESGPIVIQTKVFELDSPAIMKHADQQLKAMGVRVMTESEYKLAPGQPYLELSLNLARAQGPSHLYSVSLDLRERAKLERPKDSIVTMSVSTWHRESMGIANRPEAVFKAIDQLIKIFADEYRNANGD